MGMSDMLGGDAALLFDEFWLSGSCPSRPSMVVVVTLFGWTPARSSETKSSSLSSRREILAELLEEVTDLRVVERRLAADWRHSLSKRWHLKERGWLMPPPLNKQMHVCARSANGIN